MFVGGNEKGIAEDIQKLKKSIHIVVGTTGRLCHLVRINVLRLSYIRLFILDEADKLMEDNFQKEIKLVCWYYWSFHEVDKNWNEDIRASFLDLQLLKDFY